jgi:hypothetical protein
MEALETENLKTTAVAARIRKALKARSGKAWSVRRGRGTGGGWIRIKAEANGDMTPEQRAELAALLGLPSAHGQGVSIPASHNHYREYIDRAEGRTPRIIAEAYWD